MQRKQETVEINQEARKLKIELKNKEL